MVYAAAAKRVVTRMVVKDFKVSCLPRYCLTFRRSNSSLSRGQLENGRKITTSKVPKASKAAPLNQNLRRTDSIPLLDISKCNDQGFYDYEGKHYELLVCTTISTCESYDLPKSVELLRNAGFPNTQILIPNEAIHLKYPSSAVKSGSDVLILSSGTIIAFGLDEKTVMDEIFPLLKDSMITPYNPQSEDMDYIEINENQSQATEGKNNNENGSFMDGDIICIRGSTENERLLDKTAFAFGLSRSTRLAILESSLEQQIPLTRKSTEELCAGRKLRVNGTEVLRSIGKLLLLRGKLNLYSELIETPDLYWSEPNLEKIYRDISRNLDISPRINILNRKLDYATDESRAVLATLNEEKAVRLEWIIIYLIMVEVAFETFHFYERYGRKKSNEDKNDKLLEDD
ncbi:hypothetical protein PACTADRAFT_48432 [Pachysolen tannophilus NRRL Y-2460]|uniref:DUF155 domain-containing protein n=1 Tax=Pachysolen tannophilus NRRL Y-2460 TaxID=669874 RepID=A0A1E4TY07_PACTA|nr:hypothetical protein PACTADRAFT_48432 [Pachysolen tannophilus NRRL Y-2460]